MRNVAASASRRIGILRKTSSEFRDSSIVSCCFCSFFLPVLEYCSPVWIYAAVSHLSLVDWIVRSAFKISGGVVRCDLWHRHRVAALSLFYCIRGSAGDSLGQLFNQLFTAGRPTHHNLAMLPFALVCPRCLTSQYSSRVCLFLLEFCYEICLMSRTSLAIVKGAFKTSVNITLVVRFT